LNETNGSGEARQRAYAAGARFAREHIRRERPENDAALRAVEEGDVVVVRGCYDRVEQVLDALGLPYRAVEPASVGRLRLRPEQLVVVNCPGQLDRRALTVVERFVHAGGSLFTTDWALRNVIEPVFPGLIAYNEHATRDDVVRIQVQRPKNRFLAGVLERADDPQWWLEGASYPIRVLDPARVEVLISSREMQERYGEPAIAVFFRWGEGEVLHMVSHYYLQRTELRTARHAAPAAAYKAERGSAVPDVMLEGLSLGEVESAASSAEWLADVIAGKKRRHMKGGEWA